MSNEELSPGTLIRGTYQVQQFIGDGGAGAVYIAEHINLGHQVAVKTLYAKFVRDPDMRQRFIEEAVIQANLSHPNIVQVTDVLDEPPLCAIIMEYVSGGSLDKHLRRNPELPIKVGVELMLQVLEGMQYAHDQGVVHRDIKPANILLANTVPKITDFGIAKVISDNARTETGTAMGTIYYAAPEQLTDAKSVDRRADIYALGCTFFELLTGRLPFEEDTMYAVMQKHLQAPRPDASRVRDDVPRDLAAVVMRAMAVRPDHRFESCTEFASEIRRSFGLTTPPPSDGALDVTAYDAPISQQPTPRGGAAGVRSRTSASIGPRRRTGLSSTHPGRIDAPARDRHERNYVSLAIWALIGSIVVALVAVMGVRMLGAGEDPPDTPPIAALGSAPEVLAAPAPAVVPSPTNAPVEASANNDADVAAGSGEEPPATDQGYTADACIALASEFAVPGAIDISLEEAIGQLEAAELPCQRLLEAGADDAFERKLAFLSTVQAQMVRHTLRAELDAKDDDEDACFAVQTAVTQAHRGLREIADAPGDGLLEYELISLRPYGRRLAHLYIHLLRTHDGCSIPEIPHDLLGEEASAVERMQREVRGETDAAPELPGEAPSVVRVEPERPAYLGEGPRSP